jgi:hypothetical protein
MDAIKVSMSLLGLACLGAVGCYATAGGGPEVATTAAAAPNGEIGMHHTFAFGLTESAPQGFVSSPRTLEVERRMRGLIAAALTQKGYTEDPDKGEILVRFGASNAHEAENPETANTMDMGRLGIDVYDATTKVELWRAVAVVQIDPKQINDRIVGAAVSSALATFPARVVSANEATTTQAGRASKQP